jgi:hypothetical protein
LLKESRLAFFRTRLKKEAFNSPSWSVAVIEGQEGEWRADGQHTSTVLATCEPSAFPKNLGVTINRYSLTSADDGAILFDLFDNPMAARSNTDKLGFYVADYQEMANLNPAFLCKVAKGIDYLRRDLLREDGDQKIIVFSAREHGLYFLESPNREFALWLDAVSHTPSRNAGRKPVKHAWMISKPGIVAQMFAGWLTDVELASHFWGEVLNESNPDPADDTRELSTKLKEWAQKPKVKQPSFRSAAKKAWDKYLKFLSKTKPPTAQAA